MPINYEVLNDGHFIHAKTSGKVTGKEFVDFEIAHAVDKRLKPPVKELLEIENDSLKNITENDITKVMDRREKLVNLPNPHRCAIVVSLGDIHGFDLAKYYGGMVSLHYPEDVIIFGDEVVARAWLGIDSPLH